MLFTDVRAAAFFVFVSAVVLLGQSTAPVSSRGTFQVKGMVQGFQFSRSIGAEITFQSEGEAITVRTNGQGLYQADLPWGLYTMTANYNGLSVYERPPFRVTSPGTIIFNLTFYPTASCETVVPVDKSALHEIDRTCNGLERFTIPSSGGARSELLIHYPYRLANEKEYTYWGPPGRIPVFVAYELFTLEANQITYHKDTHEIRASGNVVSTNESGVQKRADTATFKITEGHVTQLEP